VEGARSLAPVKFEKLEEGFREFKGLLRSGSESKRKQALTKWENDEQLKKYFCGLPIEVLISGHLGRKQLSFAEVIDNFRDTFYSLKRKIIEEMMEMAPVVKSWYFGYEVSQAHSTLPLKSQTSDESTTSGEF
jgi:hypothetical protein